MSNRECAAALILFATASGMTAPAGAQTGFEPPRLADGRSDLQGMWDFRTLTPLERPAERAGQVRLTPDEASAIEDAEAQRAIEADRPTGIRTEPLPPGGIAVSYNDFWNDRGAGVVDDRRTSLIVDPPDGRIPPPRPGARRQLAATDEAAPPDRPVRFLVGGIRDARPRGSRALRALPARLQQRPADRAGRPQGPLQPEHAALSDPGPRGRLH